MGSGVFDRASRTNCEPHADQCPASASERPLWRLGCKLSGTPRAPGSGRDCWLGRDDIVRFLVNVDMFRIQWKSWSLN